MLWMGLHGRVWLTSMIMGLVLAVSVAWFCMFRFRMPYFDTPVPESVTQPATALPASSRVVRTSRQGRFIDYGIDWPAECDLFEVGVVRGLGVVRSEFASSPAKLSAMPQSDGECELRFQILEAGWPLKCMRGIRAPARMRRHVTYYNRLPLVPMVGGLVVDAGVFAIICAVIWLSISKGLVMACRRLTGAPGTCRRCGYDLRLSESDRCPECGRRVGRR